MVPLALVSFWMWTLVFHKLIWLYRVRAGRISLDRALDRLDRNSPQDASPAGPRNNALSWFLARRRRRTEPDRYLWLASIRRQEPELDRHLGMIIVLAASAPLLGLLGTVTGMVETFQVIGQFGTANAQALASGIKEALISTQAGLLVAIPGLLTGHFLKKRVRGLRQDLWTFHQAVDRRLKGDQTHARTA